MQVIFLAFTLKNSSVAEFFVHLANRLAKKYQVYIFTHATEEHDLPLSESVRIFNWPSKRPTKIADYIFLTKKIREYKPITMIANFGAVNVFMLGGYLMGVKNRVAWYHTLTTQLGYNRWLYWRKGMIYQLATLIISNSESAKVDFSKTFDKDREKILVVPNAIKDHGKRNVVVQNKLIYAGRLHTVKGIKVLVKAMAIVKEHYPEVLLEVIGGEDEAGLLAELKDLQKDLNLEKNIQFVGNRSKENVLQSFSTAYCSIVPSYYEAFGYVVIESFSVGTPVVGANTTGIAEIIEDNISGLLFEPGNSEELAFSIMELFEKFALRQKLAAGAYMRFKEKYELNKVVERFVTETPIFGEF